MQTRVKVALSALERDRWIADNGHACYYCDLPMGTVVSRRKDHRYVCEGLFAVVDHFAPISRSHDNSHSNYVLSCQICNGIKSAREFSCKSDAKDWIQLERERFMLRVVWVPETPASANFEKYSAEYDCFLSKLGAEVPVRTNGRPESVCVAPCDPTPVPAPDPGLRGRERGQEQAKRRVPEGPSPYVSTYDHLRGKEPLPIVTAKDVSRNVRGLR